ncbi:hypothetical protein EDD18DRAFT_1190663, partial [Armillaria luteobubalina]
GIIAYLIIASTTRSGIANLLGLLGTSSSHPSLCRIFRLQLRSSACCDWRSLRSKHSSCASEATRLVTLHLHVNLNVVDYCAEIPWKIITGSNLEFHWQGPMVSATQSTNLLPHTQDPRRSLPDGRQCPHLSSSRPLCQRR